MSEISYSPVVAIYYREHNAIGSEARRPLPHPPLFADNYIKIGSRGHIQGTPP